MVNFTLQVTVETLEKGFVINVFSEKNCPGLLVSILEAFEELGLELSDARVSCSDSFRLEAVSEVRFLSLLLLFFLSISCLWQKYFLLYIVSIQEIM